MTIKKNKLLLIFLITVLSNATYSSVYDYFPKNLEPSSSNYGITGIIQMPNARLMDEGSMKIGYSNSSPYEYTYITATPFSWFEASYKYTEIKNQLYGPSAYSGNQTLKDKGFDLKFRIIKESYYLPEISVGWNDLAGTGKFAAEYISATKQIRDIDFTVGMAWGFLGQNQNIKNPFVNFSEDFRVREFDQGEGGSFNYRSWFAGEDVSIFSGLEYYLWRYGIVLKLEYDTSNLNAEANSLSLQADSKFNIGIIRPVNENLTVGFSFERGNQFRFSFDLKGDYGKRPLVKKNDPPKNVIKLNPEQRISIARKEEIFYRSLNRTLREESIFIQSADVTDDEISMTIAQNRFRSYPRAIGRATRIASALSQDSVKKITVTPMNGDVEVYSVEVRKKDFDLMDERKIGVNEMYQKTKIFSSQPGVYKKHKFQPDIKFPEIFFNMSPSLRHQIGGPEAFYLGQLWWKINTKIKFNRGLTLHTVLGLNIYDTFDEFANPSSSSIPKVRSDIQEYLSQGKNNIARFKLDYIWSPYKDVFARIDVGYLEEMFGGYGGEVYYRPFQSNFSTSLQFHRVQQRNFDQRFGFKDYKVNTGHLSFYYDFPKGIQSQFIIGKYLAGDKGATIDLSRRFTNGFTLGVFATKTNLSAKEFGEGSFDKGFYFSIPTESFFTDFRQGDISFGLHPLTKDGGAMLNHLNPLYALYGDTNINSFRRDWRSIND